MIDKTGFFVFSDKRVDNTFRYTMQLCRSDEFFTAIVKSIAEMMLDKSGFNTAESVFINGLDDVIQITVKRMTVQEFRKTKDIAPVKEDDG